MEPFFVIDFARVGMDGTPQDKVRAELKRLSDLFAEVSHSFARLAELLPANVVNAIRPVVYHETAPPAEAEDPASTHREEGRGRAAKIARAEKTKRTPINWPWEKIVAAALQVLKAEPSRLWRMAELSRAVQNSGLELETIKGMHFGLVARLKHLGVLEETEDGQFRSKLATTPPPAMAPKLPPPPPREKDDVDLLAEEIDSGRPYLDTLSRQKRTAQVSVWAGLARALQDRLEGSLDPVDGDKKGRLHAVFGRLSGITRDLMCDWVDALTRQWRTDWEIYIEHHKARVAGFFVDLPPEKLAVLRRDTLKGLGNRPVSPRDAETAILEAAQVLPENDPDLRAAVARYGRPGGLGSPPSSDTKRQEKPKKEKDPATGDGSKNGDTAAERIDIPAEVLAWTHRKRALIAGGQGERPEQRDTIEKALGFAELEWVTGERNQSSQFQRLEERMRPGRYDVVIYLAGFSSHKAGAFVRSVKESGIPLVYITRGYSLSSIVHAIQEQLVERRTASTSL